MTCALIFDFDGLMLDTETPEYEAWRDLCADHGVDLPLELYLRAIGSSYESAGFNPADYLLDRADIPLTRQALIDVAHQRRLDIINQQDPLPGVINMLVAAEQSDIPMAVASSSSLSWVSDHLERLGLLKYFESLHTRDDVEHIKPSPDVYLHARQALGYPSHEIIVFEDSAHGITAAKSAGLFVVAVPNQLTRHADLSHADLVVNSLSSVRLDEVIAHIS